MGLRSETFLPAPLDRAFAFFADAANLERLTPSWVKFRIRTPLPIAMGEGAIIDYRITVRGLPIPWRTRIDVWEPGVRFVDRQVAGPYRWWHHEHRFERADGGTRIIDTVEFVPRMAGFTSGFVASDVERIFAFRNLALLKCFEAAGASAADARQP
jgi:ligand-binding SRPBCC domain-containing protein